MEYRNQYLNLSDKIMENIRSGRKPTATGLGSRVEQEPLEVTKEEDVQQKFMAMVRSAFPERDSSTKEEIKEYLDGGMSDSEEAPNSSKRSTGRYDPSKSDYSSVGKVDGTIAKGIAETAEAIGMDPEVLATIVSYETAGTFNPTKKGPTTKWGQHKGLIQFGEVQAKEYGVDFSNPEAALASQLGPDGAVAKYFINNGWKQGMSELDAYSIVNAGGPGLHNRSDTAAGGAPGTVKDKVFKQFGPHRRKARALLETYL